MQKLKTFWHVLKHSLIPLDYYYHKLRTTHFSFSAKYFVSLVFGVVFVATILKASMFVISYTPDDLRTLITSVEEHYPEDLVIHINELGRLSTNDHKPYILFSPFEKNPRPLVVIDPRADKEKIYEYESNVLFTERRMIFMIDSGMYELNYQLSEPLRIDSADIASISNNAQVVLDSYWVFIVGVMLAAMFIAPPLILAANIVTLLIASFVVLVVLSVITKKRKFTYQKLLQISLHAVTGPLLIQCFMFIFALKAALPYWYMLLVYLFLAGGVYEAYFAKKK